MVKGIYPHVEWLMLLATSTPGTYGSWGCEGMWRNKRFQFQWSPTWVGTNIKAKELNPIVLAAILQGHCWLGRAVRFRCNYQAIVHCILACSSKEPLVAQLLRGLLMAAHRDFHPVASHIARLDNGPTDSLSRNALSLFTSQVPEASSSFPLLLLWSPLVGMGPFLRL